MSLAEPRMSSDAAIPDAPAPNCWAWWVMAAGAAAAWGALAGWWTPRGPLTTAQALWSIAISVVVGVAAAWLARSRWAMLVAPLAFAVAFEVARAGTAGPTADGIHASEYGLFAFVVGRGFRALASVLPLALGAAFGAGLARRGSVGPPPTRSPTRTAPRSPAASPSSARSTSAAGNSG